MFWNVYRDEATDEAAPSGGGNGEELANGTCSNGAPVEAITGEPQGSGVILSRIFELLDRAGLPYCVLHGYRRFPHVVPSDVDCMMPADVLPGRLAALLQENRGFIGADIVQWVHEDTHYFVLAGRNADGSVCFLHLDVCSDYELRNRRFYGGQEVIGSRRRHASFWVPSPQIEFGCYLVRRIAKGRLGSQHARRLSELFEEDPDGCRLQIQRFWSARSAELISDAAVSGDWNFVRNRLRRLRGELLRRATIRRPLEVLANSLARIVRRLARWCRPRHGFHLVLLGPDGAGKSSVARAVRQDLAPAFFDTTSRTFPPALLNRGGGSDRAPHAVRPRSLLMSAIRALAYWFVYYRFGHYFTVHVELARFTLVIHDRHLFDVLVDPRRYRYAGPRGLLRLICRMVARPDLVIALDAPPEVLQARKQEVQPEETSRQCEAYRQLARWLGNGQIVDASRPLGRVIADVDQAVLRSLAIRSAHRLGLCPLECVNADVISVVRNLTGEDDEASWIIERLGRGEQAEVFTVRSRDGRRIWREHEELVVKLYRRDVPEYQSAAVDEFECLLELNRVLDGREFGTWRICAPLPLAKSDQPPAVAMTRVTGISLNKLIGSGAADGDFSSALSAAVVAALEQYWTAAARIYGDLDLNNILCDPSTRTLAFIDPGMPENAYKCPEAPDQWFPASRDLAYMLFDVCASLKSQLTNPGARRRQTGFIQDIIGRFMNTACLPGQRSALLSELEACARVHLSRIRVAWSPAGVCHWFVRHTAANSISQVLCELDKASVGAMDELAR